MSKHLVLGTLVVGVLVYVLWNPVGALLFGGPAFSSGAAGEWVGTMEISNGYDPARMGDTPGPHKQAAIYFKLESTDRFMDAYGGSGEFFIAGETEPRPLRIGAFTLHLPNTNVSTAFISPHFLDATLDHSSYSNGQIVLRSTWFTDVQFVATLHRGTKADYEKLIASMNGKA
jgi:hypothetical protein